MSLYAVPSWQEGFNPKRASFEDLVQYMFKLAYSASDYTHATDYTDAYLATLQDEGRDRLSDFGAVILKERERRHQQFEGTSPRLHPVQLDGEFHHFDKSGLAFTIVKVEGVDTYGYDVAADQLQIQKDAALPKDEVAVFIRRGTSSDTLKPSNMSNSPPLLVNRLIDHLETIIDAGP